MKEYPGMETFVSGLTLIGVSERRIIDGGVENRLRNSINLPKCACREDMLR